MGEGDGAPLLRRRCSDGRIRSTWRIVAALAERGDAVGDRVYKARFDAYWLAMILIGAPRIVSGNETTEPTPLIAVWPTSLAW